MKVDMELRLRGIEGAYVVEDALVAGANVADDDLEACMVSAYRGRRLDADGVVAGTPLRLSWSVLYYLKR